MESKSQVELLHEISNIVSSNLTLEKMLQELIGLAVEVTSCDACLVYLVDFILNIFSAGIPYIHSSGPIGIAFSA